MVLWASFGFEASKKGVQVYLKSPSTQKCALFIVTSVGYLESFSVQCAYWKSEFKGFTYEHNLLDLFISHMLKDNKIENINVEKYMWLLT